MISVTFTGFRTLAQAKVFAEWYSGSGEQHAVDWMEIHAGVTSVDSKKIEVNENDVTVALEVLED